MYNETKKKNDLYIIVNIVFRSKISFTAKSSIMLLGVRYSVSCHSQQSGVKEARKGLQQNLMNITTCNQIQIQHPISPPQGKGGRKGPSWGTQDVIER